jgi:hypothetical protein
LRRFLAILAFAVVAAVGVGTSVAVANGPDTTTICHLKPGFQNGPGAEFIQMEVPNSALDAHLAHGDTLGSCGGGGTVTVTVPGGTTTVTVPGETVTVPGETVTLPGETVTVPSQTVTLPGQTVTVEKTVDPVSAVTVPGPTVTVTVPGPVGVPTPDRPVEVRTVVKKAKTVIKWKTRTVVKTKIVNRCLPPTPPRPREVPYTP